MFRFDHDASRQGVGGCLESSGPADPQVCEPSLIERAAAPAIYWPRRFGVGGPATVFARDEAAGPMVVHARSSVGVGYASNRENQMSD